MFIFMSQLFAFFSFLIFLYILTVYLIHSIWEKVTLYNRGFSPLRWVCNKDKLLRKYLLNKWFKLTYFFYTYNILPQKLKSCQNQSVCFTPAYRRDIRPPYISEECRLNVDSIYFHLDPFEKHEDWRMMIQYFSIWILLKSRDLGGNVKKSPFAQRFEILRKTIQNLDFRVICHYQYDTISNVVEK